MDTFIYLGLLLAGFAVLAKSASTFVDSAVRIAEILSVPKMIIGIVLVGFATTAPEFAVSVQSAYLGHPEIALGNAVGSVICDDGLAMALAAVTAPSFILIDGKTLRSAGSFLIFVCLVTYAMAWDGTFTRYDGMALVSLLAGYIYAVYRTEKKRRKGLNREPTAVVDGSSPASANRPTTLKRQLLYFLLGLTGVIVSSRLVLWSSINLATAFNVSEVIIGLTVIALGTSLPEISTCIAAARKGEGEIAAGDIIGADILNMLWIVGVSSVVNPLHVSTKVINFMFPWMLVIVGTMLLFMRIRHRMEKWKGLVLLSLYGIYIVMTARLFY
ncbi:MAG: calcium/sodium antiporter [Deltaproteobacteria bacterium]|nr:calcium/sodium antiporter [Deltaproteobacteria bacterium]